VSSRIPYFFFIGDGAVSSRADEIKLNVPDDYLSLTYKSKESLAWAVRQGFTHAFRAFTDTHLDVGRLAQSGFAQHDYVGNDAGLQSAGFQFTHGGPGFWTGPRAINILLDSPILKEKYETDRYEDQWAGRVLYERGMVPFDDKRYSMGWSYGKDEPAVLEGNDTISEHLSSSQGQYFPDWMYAAHARRFGVPYTSKERRRKGCNCAHCRNQEENR